jgi:hypothetical protein
MSLNNHIQKFKILNHHSQLVQGITDKHFGNIDCRFGKKKHLLEKRKKLKNIFNIATKNLYEMEQTHGSVVKIIDQRMPERVIIGADALISDKKDIFLMIKTADCFPIIYFDPVAEVIAAIHVGWRGAMENILSKVLTKMSVKFGTKPENLIVAVGPGIQKCCYKYRNFKQEKLLSWQNFIRTESTGKSVDLQGFITSQLTSLGIKSSNIEMADECTCCSQRFFSHYRAQKTLEQEGRFATIIGMRDG